ncbi:MAG: hypothetical protein FVQ81_18395 [Candidatus Glassbacteria bacterium]|nr:hypothetical protein [Candidatus Glassbacteria bacterium]
MARNEFENPSNAKKYSWQVNHSTEDDVGKARTVESSANTANTGLNPQQADDQPLLLKYAGTIFHKAQLEEMIGWFNLCATQTIYFHDFAGESYEVLITSFKPVRHRTIHNPKDFANAPLWFWKYTIEMRVVRVIDGVWDSVVV